MLKFSQRNGQWLIPQYLLLFNWTSSWNRNLSSRFIFFSSSGVFLFLFCFLSLLPVPAPIGTSSHPGPLGTTMKRKKKAAAASVATKKPLCSRSRAAADNYGLALKGSSFGGVVEPRCPRWEPAGRFVCLTSCGRPQLVSFFFIKK